MQLGQQHEEQDAAQRGLDPLRVPRAGLRHPRGSLLHLQVAAAGVCTQLTACPQQRDGEVHPGRELVAAAVRALHLAAGHHAAHPPVRRTPHPRHPRPRHQVAGRGPGRPRRDAAARHIRGRGEAAARRLHRDILLCPRIHDGQMAICSEPP